MKKFSFILLIATVLNVANVFAQTCDYSGTTGPLQWCLKDGTLTISGTGAMPDYVFCGAPWWEYQESIVIVVIETGVTTIGNSAFQGCTSLTAVTIPNSVTTIGNSAFVASSLTSVTIPNSVTTIGNSAFQSCTSLTAVTIPNSVTTIGNSAFRYSTSLIAIDVASGNNSYASENGILFDKSKNVLICYPAGKTETSYIIPNSVTTIGYEAFCYCKSLTSITIPNNATTIGDYAFSSCTSLTSITIPNSVTTIGEWAFQGCTSLSITIPNNVTTIGSFAFSSCTSLTSVTIPNSVTTIGNSPFIFCENLYSINVDSGNNSFTSEAGILFDKNKTTVICYPAGKTGTTYTIPNSVTSIGYGAFLGCSSLTSITIPNNVTTIEGYAFSYCISLTSVTIPERVESIGRGAFYNCKNLTSSIVIPDGVNTIEDYTFYLCSSLTSVTIPNSVDTIGNNAFEYCVSLQTVTIPNGVIKDYAFEGCTGLTSVIIGNTVTSIGTRAFSPNALPAKLTSVTLGNSVTTIGDGAFVFCDSLTSITIPNSVINIGVAAFSCMSLTSVTLGGNVETIEPYAFYNSFCIETFVNLNATPTDIEDNVFRCNNGGRKAHLIVATSAVSAYQNAAVWQEFDIMGGGILVNPKSNNIAQGYTTGEGLYEANSDAIVTATANNGYHFVNWTKNGVEVSKNATYSFTVTEDVELVANFAEGVGIETITNDELRITVFPNPTSGVLHVETQLLRQAQQPLASLQDVEIFDMMGRHVQSLRFNVSGSNPEPETLNVKHETVIDISHLPSGIYFIRIQTENGTVTQKIIKN